jgi:hypothetical protein
MTSDNHLDLNLLAAHLDDRLDASEKTAVVLHLSSCEACRATLAAFARASVAAEPRDAGRATLVARVRPGVWMSLAASLAIATVAGVLRMSERLPSQVPPAGPDVGSIALPSSVPPHVDAQPTPSVVPEVPASQRPPAVSRPAGDDNLIQKRGGQREIAGKTFRLIAGEWVDAAYDPLALLPLVHVQPSAREVWLERLPDLVPYAALGPRVLVVHQGTVYRFDSLPSSPR